LFQEAMASAVAHDGETFEAYRRSAQQVYRQHDPGAHLPKCPVPRNGLPKKLRVKATGILAPNGTDIHPVDFEWTDLPASELFRINKEVILLNASYRRKIPVGVNPSGADVPLFKLMLFLLVRDDLGKDSSSPSRRRHLDKLNRLLSQAVAFARG
jgi:hypothetical protein